MFLLMNSLPRYRRFRLIISSVDAKFCRCPVAALAVPFAAVAISGLAADKQADQVPVPPGIESRANAVNKDVPEERATD